MTFVWFTATNIGVTARAAPAANPAPCPHERRMPTYIRATPPIPATASGNSSENWEYPKILVDSTCTQRESGGLSTDTKFPESRLA